MLPFDVIDSAGHGYRKVWAERSYLAKIALIPLLIKITCHITLVVLGWQDHYFRQALVMLPAYFADGWMIAHFVRLIFLGQRWPFRPTGEKDRDLAVLEDRAHGVISGMLTFAVINFFITGFMAFLFYVGHTSPSDPSATPENPGLYLFVLVLMGLSIWGFRFLWLYIPTALNVPLKPFIKDLGGFTTSLAMIATWIIGYMPLFFVFILATSTLLDPYSGHTEDVPVTLEFLIGALNVLTDTVVSLVTTGGIAYGLKELMQKRQKK